MCEFQYIARSRTGDEYKNDKWQNAFLLEFFRKNRPRRRFWFDTNWLQSEKVKFPQ